MKIKLEKDEVIPATFDPVFKEIFTSGDCHKFTCRMISGITGINEKYLTKNLKVINNELSKTKIRERTKRTNVLLSIEGHIINLEMNNLYYDGLFEKNDIYQHSIINQTAKVGDSYTSIKRVIQINIDNFSKFEKEISVFKLMEIDTKEIENENYIKFHISLPKIQKKYYNREKLNYLEKQLFMITVNNKKMLKELSLGDEVLMELKKKVEVLSEEEAFSNLYDEERQRMMIENDKLKYAKKQGLEKGLEQGEKQKTLEIARTMLKKGFTKEDIIECTGITKEELNKLG